MSFFNQIFHPRRGRPVLAHVRNPDGSEAIQELEIGRDVSRQDVKRHLDGERLFMIRKQAKGATISYFVTREDWESSISQLNEQTSTDVFAAPHLHTRDSEKDSELNYKPSTESIKELVASHAEIIEKLVRQTIDTQSFWYRFFKEQMALKESEVSQLEIAFFSLTTVMVAYLRYGKGEPETKTILTDEVALKVIKRSIGSRSVDIKALITTFQARYKEYYDFVIDLGEKGEDHTDLHSLWAFYQYVTDTLGERSPMLLMTSYESLMHSTLRDQIYFVKVKINDKQKI